MSTDQFRRYRQIGMYGGYRVVLRTIPGLTTGPGLETGDGWTPGSTAHKLANLVNDSLPSAARLKEEDFKSRTHWGHWDQEKHAEYWTKHGWAEWKQSPNLGVLPTSDGAIRSALPPKERSLLEPALFAEDSTLRITAKVLASATAAQSHAQLCEVLADSTELAKKLKSDSVKLLPTFSRFADAAMHAMRGLWEDITRDGETQAPSVETLAGSAKLKFRFELLRATADAWLRSPGLSDFGHGRNVTQLATVTRLAEEMRKAATCSEQIRVLSRHHNDNGGGRRWFREESGRLVPLLAGTGIVASDYRFRLRALCLLASQCGVAKMDAALDAMSQEVKDEEEKDYT